MTPARKTVALFGRNHDKGRVINDKDAGMTGIIRRELYKVLFARKAGIHKSLTSL